MGLKEMAALLALLAASPALAAEPVGCDKFAWPLDAERAMLTAPDKLAPGAGTLDIGARKAVALHLAPQAEANLPMAPTRAPKSDKSFAGFVRFAAPAKPGTFKVTLSAPAWIDVVQNGAAVKSSAFTGSEGCAGVRKSVKFDLAAAPFALEISGAATDAIAIAVTPAS